MDPEPQKPMDPLSTLRILSTWCQVISKIQNSQKLTETTLLCNTILFEIYTPEVMLNSISYF
jgi:hypothetical protein